MSSMHKALPAGSQKREVFDSCHQRSLPFCLNNFNLNLKNGIWIFLQISVMKQGKQITSLPKVCHSFFPSNIKISYFLYTRWRCLQTTPSLIMTEHCGVTCTHNLNPKQSGFLFRSSEKDVPVEKQPDDCLTSLNLETITTYATGSLDCCWERWPSSQFSAKSSCTRQLYIRQ